MIEWLFLAVSCVGAVFTVNAFRPSRRVPVLGPSFFAGWLTSELPTHHLAWQLVATALFVSLGALGRWPGLVGLGVTALSWGGLLFLESTSAGAGRAMERALSEGLGADYQERVAPGERSMLSTNLSLRELALPFYLRDRRVEVVRDVVYAPGAGRKRQLDVYRPRGGVAGAPVLLELHGGAWILGDKASQGLPLMLHLAAQGWVCVAANYRLSPRATFPDHLVDCKLALKWIREHVADYGGDPGYVVVTGGSAGGHLAALVALTPNDPQFQPGFEATDTSVAGCVSFYGVYDFADRFGFRGSRDRLLSLLERAILKVKRTQDPAAFERASPMSHVGPDAPPFLVVHGTHDVLAPVEEARRFAELLRATSRQPVVYAEIPGAHHAFDVFHSVRTAHVIRGVARFLAFLRGSRPTSVRADRDVPPTAGDSAA